MADVARAFERLPARERLLRDFPYGEHLQASREAAHHGFHHRAPLRDFREPRLAVARGTAGAGLGAAVLEERVPRKRVPEHDLEGLSLALDLAPDHRGAPLALPLHLAFAPGARERAARDQ